MKIGYVRVSTTEQNTARQETLMSELGVEQLYIDRASGKSVDRPELKKMLAYAREGDTVIVESISRFARNTERGHRHNNAFRQIHAYHFWRSGGVGA